MTLKGSTVLAALSVLLAACQTGGSGQRAATGGAEPAPVSVNDDDERLLGMTPDALLAELGAPPVKRREAPAEVWQYAGRDCVLDVFLYDQGAGQAVVHYEARDNDAHATDARSCFAELLRRKKAGQIS